MGRRLPAASAWQKRLTRQQNLQLKLDNKLAEQAKHNSDIIALMKRVIDLMSELMSVRAALKTAGPPSAGDARHAAAALKDAGRVLRRVSCQFSIG